MKFTERQEWMVGHFLRESGYIVKNLSPPAQTQTLLQVRQRLSTELLHFQCETVEDDDLSGLLERLRVSPTGWQQPSAPSENCPVSNRTTAGPVSLPAEPFLVEERRLLGVCVALSERTAFPLRYVRTVFVMAGLSTGPFALIVYLGLYFEMLIARDEAVPPPFALAKLAAAAGPTLVALTALYAAVTAILALLDVLYELLVSAPAGLGEWQRFADYSPSLFLVSLLVLVPIAVLSALPVPVRSRTGIRHCLHAGLSIYAVVICVGIASHLTGILVGFAQGYNG